MDDKEMRDQDEKLKERNAELEAENAALEARLEDAESRTVIVRRGGRARTILVGLLILLTCLAVVVTGVAIWTHYTVLNTKGYINLVAPIGKDPEAIKALSGYVAGQVVTATDLQQRTQDALPPKAGFLAAPIT
ncbi:MAG TPA: hypothetical protein VIL79_02610, partial [Thermoleophilia bacterium]